MAGSYAGGQQGSVPRRRTPTKGLFDIFHSGPQSEVKCGDSRCVTALQPRAHFPPGAGPAVSQGAVPLRAHANLCPPLPPLATQCGAAPEPSSSSQTLVPPGKLPLSSLHELRLAPSLAWRLCHPDSVRPQLPRPQLPNPAAPPLSITPTQPPATLQLLRPTTVFRLTYVTVPGTVGRESSCHLSPTPI